MIENIFEVYRDLSLDVVESYLCTGDQIDFSKIENYLDKAIYLDDDVVYIDEMDYDRKVINYKNNDLVGMFCFILSELSIELESDVDQMVLDFSDLFVGRFLSPDQKIFDEFYFESTINALKDILYDIDKSTAYKDPRYWMLFEALERFLYGELDMESTQEEGVFWGISNFYQIWEDMCNHYIIKSSLNSRDLEIFYADTAIEINGSRFSNRTFGGRHVFLRDDAENPFFIEFRGQRRWMRPDIIVKNIKLGLLDRHIRFLKKNDSLHSFDVEVFLVGGLNSFSHQVYTAFCKDLKKKMKGGRYIPHKKTCIFTAFPKSCFEDVLQVHTAKLKAIDKIPDYYMIDWKYVDLFFLCDKSDKLDMDINKQLSYELCLSHQQGKASIKSQFGIPWYFPSEYLDTHEIVSEDELKKLYHRLVSSEIDVVKVNFTFVQQEYLKYA